ncbi:hypothetical protein NQ317_014627 [Molorchus minor]|uniref:CUB domain-containing protein n=1 Tax=Molorchus minor TaxID=1323400 RepID=A0ABQ9J5B4_9CUCU|nr:hypothetical protein NQ317_014627 [Molorchus minor]
MDEHRAPDTALNLNYPTSFLKLGDARIRYGNSTLRSYRRNVTKIYILGEVEQQTRGKQSALLLRALVCRPTTTTYTFTHLPIISHVCKGKLSSGSYCDRLLEGCSRRLCRIQSPNYPGIYPRNVSCHYRVRERNVPAGKHALIAVRQANFHYKEHVSKFDNSDRVLSFFEISYRNNVCYFSMCIAIQYSRIWDQCNMMQDYIEILDGWGPSATTLAHLCSGSVWIKDCYSSYDSDVNRWGM